MKKVFLMSTIFCLFILLGCNTKTDSVDTTSDNNTTTENETKDDRVKPTISITQNIVSISVGQEVNLLDGVTAFDNVDGNITNITVNKGLFDNTKPGEYIISYRVTDSFGNVGVANKKIIVINPELIFDADTELFNLGNYSLTKGEVYEELKLKYGLQTLLEMVDRDIFSSYKDNISFNFEFDESDYFEVAKAYGILKRVDESHEEFEARVKDKFSIPHLRQQAVVEQYKNNIDQQTLEQLKEEYREDVCVIMLNFNSLEGANYYLDTINNLDGEELLYHFKLFSGHEYYNENTYSPYLDSLLPCDNMRLTSDFFLNYPYNLMDDLIYNQIEVNSYNKSIEKDYNGQYYIIYKVAQAPKKETYDQTKFENDLLNRYAYKNLPYELISEQLPKIREQANLKIYDTFLYNEYYHENSNLLPKDYIVATYRNKTITQNDLFNEMKKQNFLFNELDNINKELLQLEGFEVTDEEVMAEFNKLLVSYVSNGVNYYNCYDYESGRYLIYSAADARRLLKSQLFTKKYMNSIYPFDPNLYIEKHYNLMLRVLTFNIDVPNSESIINQIINGVGENETVYVYQYDTPFTGLKNMSVEDRKYAFSQLSISGITLYRYSDSVSSIYKGYNQDNQDLNETYIELYQSGVGAYTTRTIDNVFYLYLVAERYAIPEKPENYDNYTELELQEIMQEFYKTNNSELLPIFSYYSFIEDLKKLYELDKLSSSNIEKYLLELRNKYEFKFNDDELQEIYEYYNYYYANLNNNDEFILK
jgi:hypothetical protein